MTDKTPDPRPIYAFGHVEMKVEDIGASGKFFLDIGLREVVIDDNFIILEVRGGTHLILVSTEVPVEPGAKAPFDLMVDDVPPVHKLFTDLGLDPSKIEDNGIHKYFIVREPGGHDVTVNSTHATGLPI
jgi:hypothetical protein